MAEESRNQINSGTMKRAAIPSNIGKESSIGDVGTIRSKLQMRKTQLAKQIHVEREIYRGTKKLAKMPSSNNKTRDQASLEHQYSRSKIQLLQSELAKINSSIQAYQPENVRSKQIPLIPISAKTTSRISFVSPFAEIAKKHYHMNPYLIQDAVYDFQELRFSVSTPTKDDNGVEMMFEYLSNLNLVSKRFIHPKLSHGIGFIWHDALNGVPAIQQSIIFEKASITFNIAALWTQLAAQQDRSTHARIDNAISYLEKALGTYEFMKHNFSHSPTMDMTPEVLSFLSDLMRAQVIELQWEKMVLDGIDESDIKNLITYSQKVKLVSECYRPLRELVEELPLKEYIPPVWSALIKIRDAHYKAIAHYYAAMIHYKLYTLYTGGMSDEDIQLHRASITTELHFLYTSETTDTNELFSCDAKNQMGLVKSHVNCAMVLHEYAIKYKSVCKQLDNITVLHQALQKAMRNTRDLKETVMEEESIAMISPTIQPCIIDINPLVPHLNKVKIKDSFRVMGPLPKFSAEYSWHPPRKITLFKGHNGGYGFSIKGSRPVVISKVDPLSDADREGVEVGEWLIGVNGVDCKCLLHHEVVQLVSDRRDGQDESLELLLMAPRGDDSTTPTNTS